MTPPRWAVVAGVLLVGLVIGLGVAVGSSLSSLSPDRHGETGGYVAPSPSPIPSPSPTVKAAGILGSSGHLVTNGSNTVIGIGSNVVIASVDGGHTWMSIAQPSHATGIAIDPSNPRHAIAGGAAIQVTGDGGATWTAPLKPPPANGSYRPLAISPVEPNLWLFVHRGRLLVTHDGSSTWSELSGLPSLDTPVVAFGEAIGQFFLAAGGQVFELNNYGQRVTAEPALTQGSASDLAVAGGNRVSLVARTAGGPFVFDGTSWKAATAGLSGPVAAGAGGAMVVGNGGDKVGSPGFVAYSTNSGASWSQAVGLPADQTVEAVAGQPGSSTFFAYCDAGDVYLSIDGGHAWTLVTRALRGSTG